MNSQDTAGNASADAGRGRLKLGLLALVFFGPLIAAILLYVLGIGPGGAGVNYGTLLQPAVQLDARVHYDTGLRGRWTLLVKPAGACGADCVGALVDVRQVRLATGREIDRIERAVLLPAGIALPADAIAAHPGLVVLEGDNGAGAAVADALEPLRGDRIYIVDPVGNVILAYPLRPEREALLDDLDKLLKLSRIG